MGGLRLAFNNPDAIFGEKAIKNTKSRIVYTILCLLLLPLHSMLLQLRLHHVELKIQESKNQVLVDENNKKTYILRKLMAIDKSLLTKKDKINYNLKIFSRAEKGLESVFQIFGVLILLLNKSSDTRTHKDPLHILDENSINSNSQNSIINNTIGEEAYSTIGYVLLVASIVWSFISCVLSHLGGLSVNRQHFPLVSKCLAACYAMVATTKRVFIMVMFFTPPLGLLNVLRHWQAEKTIRWHPDLRDNFVFNNTIQFGDSNPIPWSYLNRWNDSTSTPPSFELYTMFSLRYYLISFIGLFVLQLISITLIKWKFSFAFNEFNIIDHFIHSTENTIIPYNAKEWCAVKSGTRDDHKDRMTKNRKEGISLILVNAVFNCLHLIPLIILGVFLFKY